VGDGAVQTTPSELARFADFYRSADPAGAARGELRERIGVDTGEGRSSLSIEA